MGNITESSPLIPTANENNIQITLNGIQNDSSSILPFQKEDIILINSWTITTADGEIDIYYHIALAFELFHTSLDKFYQIPMF